MYCWRNEDVHQDLSRPLLHFHCVTCSCKLLFSTTLETDNQYFKQCWCGTTTGNCIPNSILANIVAIILQLKARENFDITNAELDWRLWGFSILYTELRLPHWGRLETNELKTEIRFGCSNSENLKNTYGYVLWFFRLFLRFLEDWLSEFSPDTQRKLKQEGSKKHHWAMKNKNYKNSPLSNCSLKPVWVWRSLEEYTSFLIKTLAKMA